MKTLRFGSRKSTLALAQTAIIMDAVRKAHPDYNLELVPMTTSGDITMKPFAEVTDKFGIKGLFTQELENALLDGRIDVAVHSLKDVPAVQDPRLPLIAYYHRDDPRDVLVLPSEKPATLPERPVIGCSSARRRLQVLDLYPNAEIQPVRGNVGTRLRKLDDGDFDALILAAAGLKRLDLAGRINRTFTVEEIIPAPGQGILACQGRAGDEYVDWLDAIDDPDAADCARAERTFSAALGGGCASPVGACARLHGTELSLIGFYADESGTVRRRAEATGSRDHAQQIGEQLASTILREIR